MYWNMKQIYVSDVGAREWTIEMNTRVMNQHQFDSYIEKSKKKWHKMKWNGAADADIVVSFRSTQTHTDTHLKQKEELEFCQAPQ